MEKPRRRWKDYYKILRVGPNVDFEVIKASYNALARIYRGDTTGDRVLQKKMADIEEAYEVLSKPTRRSSYDITYSEKYPEQEVGIWEKTPEERLSDLVNFAAQLAADGANKNVLFDEVKKAGVPEDITDEVVRRVFEYRSEVKRREGRNLIAFGLGMLALGLIITLVSFALALKGGTYIITTGLFTVGGITLIIGFYKWSNN